MLGCVIHGAGDLRVDELPSPVPESGQALVAIRYGGVCGSDLHYWHRGGVGDFLLKEPMVLGHEVVGTVLAYGPGAGGPAPGTPVAVHPATPCGACPECLGGRRNICRDTRYLGS
ncbi:alcohol dehydrogenase catalytic domain-containing protein, partial [Streptomyces sp. SID14478]|uniref:alcohol dehydrogenase catalytic domain-containing protein n=1 Tax=Streptomyces sp. SID14478 TaxID=2706073 RepID=UPI0013D9D53F|nr:alcohol dehydrogenase catalytic domain-containing protein [Streptomyces sp. SID14478]